MVKESKKPEKASAKKHNKPIVTKKVEKAPIKFIESSNILRWKAPDYYTFEKSPYWSLIVGLVSMVLSLVLIYTQNFFPVIIIILAVIVTFQVAHEKPKTQEFAIDESGILARDVYLPFYELDSFWIAKHGSKSVLYIGRVGAFKGPISIPLGQQSQIEVRNFLLRYLPEKLEYGEQLSERLIRIFKL